MRIGPLASVVLVVAMPGPAAHGQAIDTVLLTEQAFVHHPFVYSTFAALIDRSDRPFLYAAGVEHGLRTYDISDPAAPVEVDVLWPPAFGGLKPTNIHQDGDLLYVSLGGFQGVTQAAGLAVLDIADPANAAVLDQWDSAAFTSGSAIVRVRNGFAYLGAMREGLVVLDVNDPADIRFVSSFQPDTTWPGLVNYPPNARGMDFKGDTLLLAYDAGALRAIAIDDPTDLVEVDRYLNPLQPAATPCAYNNVRVVGDVCYVTTDFCGFEAVDIRNATAMQLLAWVNPWNCNGGSWFGSDGHANELIPAAGDSLLFVNGGDSEVLVYDITEPVTPLLVGGFIHPNDSSVAWGVDVHDSLMVLSYIDNSLVFWPPQPYYADDGGIQLFTWAVDRSTAFPDPGRDRSWQVWPNPTQGPLNIALEGVAQAVVRDHLCRVLWQGRVQGPRARIDLPRPAPGSYLVELITPQGRNVLRTVVQ